MSTIADMRNKSVKTLAQALLLAADRLDAAADRIDAVGVALGVREWADEARQSIKTDHMLDRQYWRELSGLGSLDAMKAYSTANGERQEFRYLSNVLAETERRRFALSAAVALCINDRSLSDLGTLKRAWFFSETGRDEPVGSRTWEELRVMAREHEATSSLRRV